MNCCHITKLSRPVFVISLGLLLISRLAGCTGSPTNSPEGQSVRGALSDIENKTREHTEPPIELSQFCGNCHLLPSPDSFAREVWYDEIRKGFEFYARSGRKDLNPPTPASVVDYYRQNAPEQIVFDDLGPVDKVSRSKFTQQPIDSTRLGFARQLPAVSSLMWIEGGQPIGRLLVTDMRDGSVALLTLSREQTEREDIGHCDAPARAYPCDLSADFDSEWIVAQLGSFSPYDHSHGAVIWFHRHSKDEAYQRTVLAENLGRVSDVQTGDFDGDGLTDLLVAEFGHRETGAIRLFSQLARQSAADESSGNPIPAIQPQFRQRLIDARPGTVQLSVHDWNHDGWLDFAAVISQEFECVDQFLNQRQGRQFNRRRIGQGKDLTFGSVGLRSVDLDKDGDLDLIYVNGDSFDNNFANGSHGVQWLENQGSGKFESHRLLQLAGAYQAVPGDFDLDGDWDIVVVASLPTSVYPETLRSSDNCSVVLLEQTEPNKFIPRVLARDFPRHAALEVGDFDHDGKLDFAVGVFQFEDDLAVGSVTKQPQLWVWWQK
jgi:FG-GAP repeat